MVHKVHVEDSEVVIVGAGAAGSVIAASLSQAGRKVVILEAGPAWSPRDLVNSQMWGRRLRWGGSAVISGGKNPFSHAYNMGWGNGGSALHHAGCWPRMAIEDFREFSLYGRGSDWPIVYNALRPYYDRIQAEVGISGDAIKEVWRPPGDPYPLPPLATFRHGEIVARGFEKAGFRTSPQPMAINSVPYNGRPACQYDGGCDNGCSISALANPLATYLTKAIRQGVVIRSNASVTRVITGSGGRRATAVEWIDKDLSRHTVKAKMVVLAANPIQNVRILLCSGGSQSSRGLANSNGLIGRRFMVHSEALLVGEFREETQNYLGPTAGTLHSREGYVKDARPGGPYGSSMWHIGVAIKPNDVIGMANWRPELFGKELTYFMERRAPRMAAVAALCQVAARDANYIELSNKTDRFGIPRVRTVFSMDENDSSLLSFTEHEGQRALKAAGAIDHWVAARGSAHAMGGTVMGDDPKTSVTDEFGIAHDVNNLIIAGAGLYPTAGAVNPTFTIHAIALRAAEHVAANWTALT